MHDQGVNTVLLGGPSDRELADAIVAQATRPLLVLTGKFSVLESAEMMRRCAV
ncbi:MAG: glycosyl transferase, partial [Armatimonadota bacterium]